MVRRDSAFASHLIANDVHRILASLDGISTPVVEHQYINRADFSYESNDGRDHLDQIDRMLGESGMYRLQPQETDG